MISATCPCGATFDTETKYYDSDWKFMSEWLVMHQPCVNVLVAKQELVNRKSALVRQTIGPDGEISFQFTDDNGSNPSDE